MHDWENERMPPEQKDPKVDDGWRKRLVKVAGRDPLRSVLKAAGLLDKEVSISQWLNGRKDRKGEVYWPQLIRGDTREKLIAYLRSEEAYRRLPHGDVDKFHVAWHIIHGLLEEKGLEWHEIRRVMRLIPKGKLVDLIEASSFEAVAEDLAKKNAPWVGG
jgi:hypothetical protein